MQRKAAGDLRSAVTNALVEAGLTYEAAGAHWTPRRLVLDVRGLDARSKPVREEIKGPAVTAPEQAVQGFLRKAGLSDVREAKIQSDPKKGDFYVAVTEKPGRAAEEIIAEAMPGIIRNFPWPKSMRWGAASREPGGLRWVRPLQSIVCTFGPETEESVVIDFEVGGIRSGDVTFGHRFHAPDAIRVRRFDDYVTKLERAFVVLDAERRKEIIAHDARNIAFASGLELIEDEALLDEVAGLVEWPVVLMGEFDEAFLAIPPEMIRLTIKTNQKCFVTRTPDGGLSNRFILVSNIEATDGGAEIARGNGKVVRARLSDALYFWTTDQAALPDVDALKPSAEKFGLDLAKPLDQRMARLDALDVTFHAKLGTQGARVARIAKLAQELAPAVWASMGASIRLHPEVLLSHGSRLASLAPHHEGTKPSKDEGATRLSPPSVTASDDISPSEGEMGPRSADLATFTTLCRRAALLAKADLQTEAVGEFPELQGLMGRKYAALQGEHPSVCAAIEEHYKPQGPSDSVPRDPVAVTVALADKLDTLVGFWAIDEKPTGSKDPYALRRAALGAIRIVLENNLGLSLNTFLRKAGFFHEEMEAGASRRLDAGDLLSFFHDRLKVWLKDQGARHDVIEAVLSASSTATRLHPEVLLPPGSRLAPLAPHHEGTKASKDEGKGTGEMGASRQEGGGLRQTPPSVTASGDISPSRGENKTGGINDDLLAIARRVEQLIVFLDTEDGKNLVAGTKRAGNIVAAEEKKAPVGSSVDAALLVLPEEQALNAALLAAVPEAEAALAKGDDGLAMRALARLRAPVDAFLDGVLVNDADQAIRANRLALLKRVALATGRVADFSKLAG